MTPSLQLSKARRRSPSFLCRRRKPRRAHFCESERSTVHSAHVGKKSRFITGGPLYGCRVRQHYSELRAGGRVAHVLKPRRRGPGQFKIAHEARNVRQSSRARPKTVTPRSWDVRR